MSTHVQRQEIQLARLKAKPTKSDDDNKQIAALERKLANVTVSAKRGKRTRKRGKPPVIGDRLDRDIAERAVERAAVGGPPQYGMVPLLPNRQPRDIDIRALGATPAGRAWAMEALHPCGEFQGSGMPDTYTGDVNVFEQKSEVIIGYKPSIFATAPTNPLVYDVHMLFPPIPEIACIYRLLVGDVASKWVMVFFPTTSNNNNVISTLRQQGYANYRLTARGETVQLNAAALNNQGRIYVGQRAISDYLEDLTVSALTSDTPPVIHSRAMKIVKLEYLNLDQLIQTVANPYQANAVEGAYIVHKFNNPLMGYQFHETVGTSLVPGPTNGAALTTYPTNAILMAPSNANGEDEASFAEDWADGSYLAGSNLPQSLFDYTYKKFGYGCSPPCDMTIAECYVTGISVGNTNTPGATVNVKCRAVVEAMPNTSAPIAVYSRAASLWDQTAVNAVVRYQQVQPHAYPACENDFGTVMGRVFGFLKRWVQPVTSVVKSVLPGWGKVVGEVVDKGIDVGNGFFNGSTTVG